MNKFPDRKTAQALFYPGDIFCHSGVPGFEFFVDLPDDQLGITLNQELVDRYGGS